MQAAGDGEDRERATAGCGAQFESKYISGFVNSEQTVAVSKTNK